MKHASKLVAVLAAVGMLLSGGGAAFAAEPVGISISSDDAISGGFESGGAPPCIPGKSTIAQCFPDTALAQGIAKQLKGDSDKTGEVLTSSEANRDYLSLDLENSQVTSIQGLQVFTNLWTLDLSGTKVSDVSPLAKSTSLVGLGLSKTRVSDISPLAKLTGLTGLDLSRAPVTDVSPLAKLTQLTRLCLASTKVPDVSPLAKLTKIRSLNLSGTKVSDVSPLAGLVNLEELYLAGTDVSDVSPLAKLPKLKTLNLQDTNVLDLSVFHGSNLEKTCGASCRGSNFTELYPSAKLSVDADGSVSMPAPRWIDGTVVAPSSTYPAGGVLDAKRGVVTWKKYDPTASYSYEFDGIFGAGVEFSGRVFGVKLKTFTVSFDSAGGGRVASQSVVEGGRAVRPADPKRAGYTFAGWYTRAGKAFDFDSVVRADVALVAHWKSTAKPTQPSKPSQPSKPTTPSKPSKPSKPSQPTQPSTLSKPTTPSKPSQPASDTVTMWRLYNPNSGEHFYTANTAERDRLIRLGWHDEHVGWVAPAKSSDPVYRLYNPNAGDHHYTMNPAEVTMLKKAGWKYEGVGWYSATNEGRKPLYREYNPNAKSGAHNYTLSRAENDHLVRVGWRAEGLAWYAVS